MLGGAGFSVMPELVMDACKVDAGAWADGEWAVVELAKRIEGRQDWSGVPNLVWRREGRWQRNAPSSQPLTGLPPMSRTWVDHPRYVREGGQAGLETKRGCPCQCIYCADPLAKGREMRPRSPQVVVDELERLLAQGVDHIQSCDSEFNAPEWHAADVCKEIIRRKLGDKVHWYAMCSPVPFSSELASLMRRAGFDGVNLGVDNGDEQMLRRLKRGFTPEDILNATRCCKEAGIAVMFDLLLGAPGETKESIARTIELVKRARPTKANVQLGVRVYPGTELATLVAQPELREGLVGGDDPYEPLFFIEPAVAPFASRMLDELISDSYERKVQMRRAIQQTILREGR